MTDSRLVPSFVEEKALTARGYVLIAGVDEVGRGALAGPVMAGAVILPVRIKARWVKEGRDSKLLAPAARERLAGKIRQVAISVGIGTASHEVIDSVGISRATRVAMKSAVKQLSPAPDFLLIDFFRLPEARFPQEGIVDGDSLCFSIACASIMAKVARDRLMVELDGTYPGYGFARHKGYGTEKHLACLKKLGACPIHRRSFQPVKDVCLEG